MVYQPINHLRILPKKEPPNPRDEAGWQLRQEEWPLAVVGNTAATVAATVALAVAPELPGYRAWLCRDRYVQMGSWAYCTYPLGRRGKELSPSQPDYPLNLGLRVLGGRWRFVWSTFGTTITSFPFSSFLAFPWAFAWGIAFASTWGFTLWFCRRSRLGIAMLGISHRTTLGTVSALLFFLLFCFPRDIWLILLLGWIQRIFDSCFIGIFPQFSD